MSGIELAAATVGLIHERKKLLGTLKSVGHLLTRGRQRILIAGASGTGKTTLGRLLSKPSNWDRPRNNGGYIASLGVESSKIPGLIFSHVDVLPGNSFFLDASIRQWKPYLDKLADGYYNGVIHVVSAGFHSSPHGIRLANLYCDKTFSSRAELIQHHVQRCIRRECDVLSQITTALINRKKDCWLITLITKEDLWTSELETILRLYHSNRYKEELDRLERDARSLIVKSTIPVSLKLNNFHDGDGILREVRNGFDQSRASNTIGSFLCQLEQLLKSSINTGSEND